jgi:hypothetical protein
MHNLKSLLIERLATNLKRQSVTTPSVWAENYRVMGGTRPGPWSFKQFPWLKEMHDSKAELNVGKKAAQLGFTETVLNITFFNIDVLARDCLYVLPNRTPDASDFSASRFDPALELSPHLSKLFSNVKNVGHKRAGSANLYVRGSQSRAGLKSIPVSLIVLDEIEEFNQESIPLALERASGQIQKQAWMISTPSIEDYGIDAQFKKTTQEIFSFRCPSCGRYINLDWPDNFVVTGESLDDPNLVNSYLKCNLCENQLPHLDKSIYLSTGIWVPTFREREARGFYINQMYSSSITPYEFAQTYIKSTLNPADEQEFHNSKMGRTHAVKGAQLSDEEIQSCVGGYDPGPRSGIITMGVDVGSYLNYEIDLWHLPTEFKTGDINIEARPQVLDFGKVIDFEQIDLLMNRFNIRFCIIDAQPERRKAKEFATRFAGRVKLCFYGRGLSGKQINIQKDEPIITVDRTSWLDLSLSRFRNKTIGLPKTIDLEYRENLRALVRRYRKDKDGNPTAEYVCGDKPDHYAHSRNYAEIALPFAVNLARSYNLSGVL